MKRGEQKIVPNGLNWLAPGDQVADGDCLDLQSWRCDSAGKLVQAPEAEVLYSAAINTQMNSCAYVGGRRYYGGPNAANGYLYRDGSLIKNTLSLGYIGLMGYQNWCWVMDSAAGQQWKDDGTNTWKWTPEAPTGACSPSTGAGGGVPEGAVDYYITFTNTSTLHESNPSPIATLTITAPNQKVTIASPAALTTDAQNTHYNVYRKDANMAVPYRVNQTPIAKASSYVDDGDSVTEQSSEYLVENMPALEGDHDPAPAAKVIANKQFNGRIVVANSATHPNRIWWTNALTPWYFPGSGSDNPETANWLDVGEGDSIYAITVRPQHLLIYTSRGIWRHNGDLGSGILELIAPDVGAVGFRAIVSTSKGDYFRGKEGVYRMTDWAEKISQKVDPIFRGETVKIADSLTISPEYPGEESKCALGHRNGRLWVSYATGSGSEYNDGALVCDLDSKRWARSFNAATSFVDEGQVQNFMGTNSLHYYRMESAYTTSPLRFTTRYEDQGAPDNWKTYADLVITHNTQGETLTVIVLTNGGRTANDVIQLDTTLSSTTSTRQVIPLVYPATYAVTDLIGEPIRGLNIAIRITGQGGTSPVEIDSPIILHYFVEARKAKTFDSGPTDHGAEQVKTVDMVELDLDNSDGQVTLQVQSDIPGGTLADRLGSGIDIVAAGRRKVLIPITAADGKLFRYTVNFTKGTPGAEEGFLLYGFRVRVLPIGVYVDGSVSEVWDTEPIGV